MTDQPKSNLIDLEDLRAQVEARQQAEKDHIPPNEEEKSTSGGPDDPRFVRDCLNNNERGDGILFAAMHRGQLLFNKIQGRYFRWENHYWTPDIMGSSVEGVERVALRYQVATEPISIELNEVQDELAKAKAEVERCKENDDLEGKLVQEASIDRLNLRIKKLNAERKKLRDRANSLRGKTRAEKCLWYSHHVPGALAVRGDEFDRKPMLLPCKNGVIDLETGRLHAGRPEDLLVRALPIEYDPNAKAPDWRPFLDEIHQGDDEKTDFNRRLLGYCLTGLTVEQFLACYIGEGGNGKGTLFELMRFMMGPLSWNISPELILEQKNPRPTAGPSPDIVSLYGRRLVIASETDKNRKIGAANVKRFTGQDTLNGRSPHDKEETNFEPTHKLILYTNHAPKGLTDDFALMRRLLFIEYHLRYVDDVDAWKRREPQHAELFRQKDGDLPRRLREQAQGVLADLVRGCLEWQKAGGLKPPESIIAAAEAHRESEDHLARFVKQACHEVDRNQRVKLGDFHKSYMTWYSNEVSAKDRYQPSKIQVGKDLVTMGYRKETQSGQTWVYGIGLPEETGLMPY